MTDDIRERYPEVAGRPFEMAALCQALCRRGKIADAYALGRAAVAAAPHDMRVHTLVRAALSRGVPGWHIPMLHDAARNRCYAEAIARLVEPGVRVLEIGSGAGLLAMLAARAGAEVVTCDYVPAVAAAAADIVRLNGLSDRVTVVAKRSADLRVGIDLAEPADLLLSELFDDSLFGDNVIGFVADARARLLKPGAAIVPARAELRCALAAFDVPLQRRPLGTVEGFDLSPFNLLAPDVLRAGMAGAVLRSDACSALPVDFATASPREGRSATLHVRSHGGRIDGVAQWLRLDFGGGVVYENAPGAGSRSHWGAPLHPFAEPIETAAGEFVEVGVRLFGSQLLIDRASEDPR